MKLEIKRVDTFKLNENKIMGLWDKRFIHNLLHMDQNDKWSKQKRTVRVLLSCTLVGMEGW